MDRVDDRRERKLPQDRQSRAGTTHRLTRGDVAIQSGLHRSVLPEAHVVRLVPAGQKNRLRVIDDVNNLGIIGVFSIVKHNRCRRIQRTHREYFFVHAFRIRVFGVRAQDQKVASVRPLAQKMESRILFRPAAHQRKARPRHGSAVGRIPRPKVFPFCGSRWRQQTPRQESGNAIPRESNRVHEFSRELRSPELVAVFSRAVKRGRIPVAATDVDQNTLSRLTCLRASRILSQRSSLAPGKETGNAKLFSNPRLQQVSALVAAGTLESGL